MTFLEYMSFYALISGSKSWIRWFQHANNVQYYISEKSTVSDSKPANNILSSWEKRSSHIPITNNWVEIDPVTHSPPQTKVKEARLSVDRLLVSKDFNFDYTSIGFSTGSLLCWQVL